MAQTGDELVNPVSGERIVFRQTAADTDGQLLEMDDFWTRPGHRTAEHIHPEMQERWEVVAGRVCFRVAGVERIAGPGEVVTAPAGVPHMAWSLDAAPCPSAYPDATGAVLGTVRRAAVRARSRRSHRRARKARSDADGRAAAGLPTRARPGAGERALSFINRCSSCWCNDAVRYGCRRSGNGRPACSTWRAGRPFAVIDVAEAGSHKLPHPAVASAVALAFTLGLPVV